MSLEKIAGKNLTAALKNLFRFVLHYENSRSRANVFYIEFVCRRKRPGAPNGESFSEMSFLAHILAERAKRGLRAPCFYTTGYAGREVARLPALLDFLDARLIDIRFAPTGGKQIEWRKDYLRLLLKDRYRHVPHLGNRLAKNSNEPSIQNLALGIKIITEMRANLLLLCECRKLQECHRLIISRHLEKQGFETEEIVDWNSRK